MKVAIHQPNYLPWIGYFKKMALSDVFVILDTVQFSKDSFTQRTKIRTLEGWLWLTIPVGKENHFKPIKDVLLPNDNKWMKKHKTSIISNYSKSGFYDADFIEGYYGQRHRTLQAFNEHGIFYLKRKMGIKAEILHASELKLSPGLNATDLIIDIVKQAGGDTYISGSGGDNYQDGAKFEAARIGLEYAGYQPAEYKQRWAGFEPYMSAIDRLFNLGEDRTNDKNE